MDFSIISDHSMFVNSHFLAADLRPARKNKTYIGSIGIGFLQDEGEVSDVVEENGVYVGCDRELGTRVITVGGVDLPPRTEREIVFKGGRASIRRYASANDRVKIETPNFILSVRFSSSKHSSCHLVSVFSR